MVYLSPCRQGPLAVLGGGLSGLSAAYYLSKLPESCLSGRKIILIEASNEFGGWVKTTKHSDGVTHELGPRAVQSVGLSAPNTFQLINEIGLSSRVIGNSSDAKLRYIMKQGKLVPMPYSLTTALQRSNVFRKKAPLLYLMQESMKKSQLDTSNDFTLYDMIKDRFDVELAENLADPVCRGITAGDARHTSVRALFPAVFRAIQNGSLFKWMMSSNKPSDYPFNTAVNNQLYDYVKSKHWRSWSIDSGLGTIGEKLACILGGKENIQILSSTVVKSIQPSESGSVRLTLDHSDSKETSTVDCDHVFSSLPAHTLFSTLQSSEHVKERIETLDSIRNLLQSIRTVDVAVICLQFAGKTDACNGFGFLIPSSEVSPLLGVTFDSSVFPQHDNGHNITRLTAMCGGAWFDSLFSSKSVTEISEIAIDEVTRILRLQNKPSRVTGNIHRSCIPQYTLNHAERVEQLKVLASQINLSLLGASYDGVSVNDVILSARRAVHLWNECKN